MLQCRDKILTLGDSLGGLSPLSFLAICPSSRYWWTAPIICSGGFIGTWRGVKHVVKEMATEIRRQSTEWWCMDPNTTTNKNPGWDQARQLRHRLVSFAPGRKVACAKRHDRLLSTHRVKYI